MDNQNYGFSNIDINIPLNTLKDSHDIPGTFQGDGNEVSLHFAQQNFSTHSDHFYGDLNSHEIEKGAPGNNFNISNQLIPYSESVGNIGVQVISESSELACSVSSDLGLNETNISVFQGTNEQQVQDPSTQSNLTYHSAFSEQVNEVAMSLSYSESLQPSQEQQFVTDVSPVQEFSDQCHPSLNQQFQEYQTQNSDLVPDIASLNEELGSNIVEQSITTECTNNTLEVETSYCQSNAETSSSPFISCNEESVRKTFLEVETSVLPSCNGNRSLSVEKLFPGEDRQYLEFDNTPCTSSTNGGSVSLYSDFKVTAEKAAADNVLGVTTEENLPCDETCDEDSTLRTPNVGASPELTPQKISDEETPSISTRQTSISDLESSSDACHQSPGKEKMENSGRPNECDEQHSLIDMSPKTEKSVVPIDVKENEVAGGIEIEVAGGVEIYVSRLSSVSENEESEPSNETMKCPEVSGSVKENSEENAKTEKVASQDNNSSVGGMESSRDDSVASVDTIDSVTESLVRRPFSPMITMLDDNLGEGGETSVKLENKDAAEQPKEEEAGTENIRLTRTRTGALRNKTQRLVEEMDASDDSSRDSRDSERIEDWEYEEGAETAPCPQDPFITVPENVLKVTPKELAYYHKFFANGIDAVLKMRLHCTTCGRHMGAAPNYIHLGNRHKVLRVLICNRCRVFYGVGKFPRDSDGSELFCRWCGQGGQVICCSHCPNVFCENCIKRNVGPTQLKLIVNLNEWLCFVCNYEELWQLRAVCWALLTYTMSKKKVALSSSDAKKILDLEEDKSKCCPSRTNKKKKPSNKSLTSGHNVRVPESSSLSTEEMLANESFGFGHFLFPNDNFESTMEEQEPEGEEEDFIDPSQFVQPVLEEPPQPSHSRGMYPPSSPVPRLLNPAIRVVHRSLPPQTQITPVRFNSSSQQPSLRNLSPRIIIRQGNLMQPGLVPINNQPNRISAPTLRPPITLRNDIPRTQGPSRGQVRNPASYLNNIDGVRSMDQLQSLEHAPWFRDGIDSIRAVGFALTKRIRELEARFHSLKNKSDVEKVMILGKKLERLSSKSEQRFKQINSTLKQGSRDWFTQKIGRSKHFVEHPFNLHNESPSDWEDDKELSKPLEKVLIPVNTGAFQSLGNVINLGSASVTNTSSNPPPLVRTSFVPPNSVRSGMTLPSGMQTIGRLSSVTPSGSAAPPGIRTLGRLTPATPSTAGQPVTVRTVYSSTNQANFTRIRLPGPKSSVSRYVQRPIVSLSALKSPGCITERVGAFLNKRNGENNISISLASSSKRPRRESVNSDSDSDVEVTPTIPELMTLHQIRPCSVCLEKCDDFIVAFLERQKQAQSDNVATCDFVSDDEVDESPEVETVVVACDVSEDGVSTTSNNDDYIRQEDNCNDGQINSDDDDIEIIHEVNTQSSSLQDSSDTTYVETIDDL